KVGLESAMQRLAPHLAALQQRRSQGQRLLLEIEHYATGLGCRRAALVRYFGEALEIPCGSCSGCRGMAPLRVTRAGGKKCPQCGRTMVKRQSDRGSFFGCSAFPICRGTLPGVARRPRRTRRSVSERRN